jgi:hypothetical protein
MRDFDMLKKIIGDLLGQQNLLFNFLAAYPFDFF